MSSEPKPPHSSGFDTTLPARSVAAVNSTHTMDIEQDAMLARVRSAMEYWYVDVVPVLRLAVSVLVSWVVEQPCVLRIALGLAGL